MRPAQPPACNNQPTAPALWVGSKVQRNKIKIYAGRAKLLYHNVVGLP
jgi:hypothetical protein